METGDDIQVEKGGFARIHNTILKKLALAPLRGQQFSCLIFLFRMTYGYNKKESKISLQEWSEGTNMRRQNVWRELNILLTCNVIYMKSSGPKRANTWGFNKRYEQWNFESVITGDDKSVIIDEYKSVITGDDSDKPSVITGDDKSVIIRSHARDLKDNKDNTTTTTTEGGSGGSFSDSESSILKCWRENVDPNPTPIIINELTECVATYGTREVLEAIKVAVNSDNKTMRYVKGVLNRRKPSVNGAGLNGIHTREVLVRIGDDND